MQTYTMTTTTETATGVHAETNTGLLEGDCQMIREAAQMLATPGDTVTHKVTAE